GVRTLWSLLDKKSRALLSFSPIQVAATTKSHLSSSSSSVENRAKRSNGPFSRATDASRDLTLCTKPSVGGPIENESESTFSPAMGDSCDLSLCVNSFITFQQYLSRINHHQSRLHF